MRLTKLSIETGCVTGQLFHYFTHIGYIAEYQRMSALSAGVVLLLVYLPGHQPYYAAAASIEAKIYSNSMMAMLNSRIKPVSNASPSAAPLWNESVESIKSIHWIAGTQPTYEFRRNSEISISSSRASEISPSSDVLA